MSRLVVDFVAATVAVHAPPDAPLALDFHVPTGHDTGVWTATVYLSHRATADLPLATATVSPFTNQTATASFTAAAINEFIPEGAWRFGGWWILAQDTGTGPIPWAKGPFVIDPKLAPEPGGGSRSIEFTAPGTARLVEGAVSLDVVVAALIAELLDVETAARVAGDANLQTQVTAEVAARIAGDEGWQALIDAETAARIAGDEAEALARSDADTTETADRVAADADLQATILNEAVVRAAAVAVVQAAVASEEVTRAAEDAAVRAELAVEAAARSAADAAEIAARAAADSDLDADVSTEAAAREAADAAEAADRLAADNTLQSNIDTETAARAAAVAAEAATRATGDSTLQTNLDTEAAARAAAVAAEAVARASADTSLQASVTAETAARTTADSTEATARAAADTALQGAVDTEALARAAGDSTEASTRVAEDAALQAADAAEAAARQLADTNEVAARVAGDASVLAAVEGEVANRQADVGAEAAARAAADLTINSAIGAEATARTAADTAEASTRQTADVAITATVTALDAATLKKSANLSDVVDLAAARTNLAVHYLPAPAMQVGRWYRCPAVATLTTGTPTVGTVLAMPKFITAAVLIDRIGCEVTSAGGAGSVVRLGVWSDDGTGRPGTLMFDAGTVDGEVVDIHEITVSEPLPRGWYWFGAVAQVGTAPILRTTGSPIEPVHLDLASTPTAGLVAVAFADDGVTGALDTFDVDGVSATGIAVFVRCGPVPGNSLLLEDGTSFLLLEDSSHLLLED